MERQEIDARRGAAQRDADNVKVPQIRLLNTPLHRHRDGTSPTESTTEPDADHQVGLTPDTAQSTDAEP